METAERGRGGKRSRLWKEAEGCQSVQSAEGVAQSREKWRREYKHLTGPSLWPSQRTLTLVGAGLRMETGSWAAAVSAVL